MQNALDVCSKKRSPGCRPLFNLPNVPNCLLLPPLKLKVSRLLALTKPIALVPSSGGPLNHWKAASSSQFTLNGMNCVHAAAVGRRVTCPHPCSSFAGGPQFCNLFLKKVFNSPFSAASSPECQPAASLFPATSFFQPIPYSEQIESPALQFKPPP